MPRLSRALVAACTFAVTSLATRATRAAAQPTQPTAAQVPSTRDSAATVASTVERIQLAPGRVHPLAFGAKVARMAVADTAVADVMVVTDHDVVFSGRRAGETDVLLWVGGQRRLYRVAVAAPADRPQVVLAVKFAEVRRDALRSIGVSYRYNRVRGSNVTRSGTDVYNVDPQRDKSSGRDVLPRTLGYFTLLSDLGTRDFFAILDAEEQRGNARVLAEPTLMAGNRDSASFLAGGEFPIPAAVTTGTNGQPFVTIVFKEFGVRLMFMPEILSDTLVKLHVRPEVSSLDYANAVTLSGISIPALRTRRLESTIDVPRDQSLIISGLLNDEREKVRTGIPGLMRLPVIGSLFSSTSWRRNESELVVIVTPTVVDPSRPRAEDTVRLTPDALPAREAIQPRLVTPPARPSTSPTSATP